MDITHPRVLYLKAGLFVAGGGLAAAILIVDTPTWKEGLLLGTAVWCFARAYYFAFYVVQHYADPAYRFAGLFDFAVYALRRRRARSRGNFG